MRVACGVVVGLIFAAGIVPLSGCGDSPKPGKSLVQQYQDALQVSDDGLRARRLVAVAEKQQKAGDLNGLVSSLAAAKAAALTVADPVSQANTLNHVAAAYARLDQGTDEVKQLLKESAKAIQRIESADAKVLPLADLAAATSQYLQNAEAAALHLKSAEEAAGKIELPANRAQALGRIAAAYAKAKKEEDSGRVMADAGQLADSQTDARLKADCLAEIAAAWHALKKPAEGQAAFTAAQQAAAEIGDSQSHAYALLNIAQKASASQQKAAAKKLLSEAQNVAEQVKDGSLRGPLLEEINAALKQL